MARLIDADYLLEALSHLINGNRHFVNGIRTAEELVKNAPTVCDGKCERLIKEKY